ncbi:hypothetical protein [Halohasta litchfieldiae]|nr:hypothetical protein [Halohasta litchfieldiae]
MKLRRPSDADWLRSVVAMANPTVSGCWRASAAFGRFRSGVDTDER